MYSIIETTSAEGTKEVSIVLSSWVAGYTVFWPTNYSGALKKCMEVSASWKKYDCKVCNEFNFTVN